MKTNILETVTRKLNKVGFQIQKHSPEILVAVGVVGVVTSTVLACKATIKLNDILEESKENVDKIHEAAKHPEKLPEEYTAEDSKKDLTIVYTQTAVKLAKLYAPAVVLGAVSIGMIVKSHDIMKKRNVALAAAYATVDKGFKEYRERVVDRFGEDMDRELRYNIKAREFEEKVVDENGEEKAVTKTVEVSSIDEYSVYARFFDASCKGYEKDPEYNLMFLRQVELQANKRLKSKGRLFLNDVYTMLGLPTTKAGQTVGWIYDEENPVGDNKVDFGIFNAKREKNRDFVNGYESVILLDFNVDGDIMHSFSM